MNRTVIAILLALVCLAGQAKKNVKDQKVPQLLNYPSADMSTLPLHGGEVVIKGHVVAEDAKNIDELNGSVYVLLRNYLVANEETILIDFKSDGTFSLNLQVPYPMFVEVYPLTDIYACPGDTLELTIDTTKPSWQDEGVSVSGTGISGEVSERYEQIRKAYYDKEETLSGRYEAAAGLQRCYLQKKDFRQAAEWGCLLYDTNDSIIAQRAFEETQRAKDSYIYYRDKEKEQALVQRDERIISISVMAGLALLSILMGLTAFYYYRRKALMEEIVSKDRELQERVRELRQREKINRELTQIALMNNTADDVENIIAQFRKAAVGQARLEEDSWKELMAAIETLYPGFHEAVQGRLQGQLREPLLRTICLMKIGMKPMEIAQVMDTKKQTAWNRVKRAEAACGDLISPSLSAL